MFKFNKRVKGFTLIEILVAIGIIALLAAIVIIAINPARQFAQARNSQRESNVNTILNAIGQNIADNKGLLAGGCPAVPATTTVIRSAAGGVDLACLVPTYIPTQLPADPRGGSWTSSSTYDTLYTVEFNGIRYKVCAPNYIEPALGNTTQYCLER